MKKTLLSLTLGLIVLSGCYKRTVASGYTSDPDEVEKIRKQLGATTTQGEYVNEEEEEEDE